LPDDDFEAAAPIAQEEFDRGKPDVAVGSSRGCAVNAEIDADKEQRMKFDSTVRSWAGKSAAVMEQTYERLHRSPTFVQDVLEAVSREDAQVGATWLLKKHLDNRNKLDVRDSLPLFQSLDRLEHWEARLHVLQSLPTLSIPPSFRRKTEAFLRRCLIEENKFVRAWAYNGLYELAQRFPQYRVEVTQLLESALDTEPASVKARVRKCLAKGFS
jgi:hypothetical protein